MKKLILLVITLSMLCTTVFDVYADNEIIVTLDGAKIGFDAQPVIKDDRVLVPMRAIFEKMGAKIDWFDEKQQASAIKGNTRIDFVIGASSMTRVEYSANPDDPEAQYFVDGLYTKDTAIELDVPIQIIEDRTYIPLRAISESFDYTVIWDDLFRTVSVQSPVPTDRNEIIAMLLKYNIITEDDIDKDLYITNLEALKAIRQVQDGSVYKSDLRNWYYGDTFAPLDYLDDETKELLLSISNGRGVINTEEILNTDINANLTEYQALVYLTRMIGSTYGCTDIPDELSFTEVSQTYDSAAEKGLIDTTDMANADNAITRADFYTLLAKAIYTPYMSGGAAGVYQNRYIENLVRSAERVTTIPVEKEVVKIDVDTEFDDDMSLHWTVPEGYKNSGTDVSYITGEGEVRYYSGRSVARDSIDDDEIIKIIAHNGWNIPKAIRCGYSDDNSKVYFDIDLSDIKVIMENYIIEPGTYTPYEKKWVPRYISLADGYSFKKGAYYMLISYEHAYRLPKYNRTDRMIIKSEEDTDIFSNENQDTFKGGPIGFSDMHIREIIIEGSAEHGFEIHVSEESKEIFKIKE